MKKQHRQYASYLLRMWQVEQRGEKIWRITLEDPRSGEWRLFASLESLFAFLAAQPQPLAAVSRDSPSEQAA